MPDSRTADARPDLSRPLDLGGVSVPNRVVLGPMAGVTNSAFRLHCKRHGAGLVFTEMVSAYGLVHRNRRTREYLVFREAERPLAVQLFADEPGVLREAAAIVLEEGPRPDMIDLNLGCPVRKVVKGGAGCALAWRPRAAASAVSALVDVAARHGVPVTCKIRSGPRPGEVVAPRLAAVLEQAGAAAIAVHPRAQSQMYRGVADHDVTAEVVASVSVPVIASGDVLSVDAGRDIVRRTGAEAVMVARGAQGNPWLLGGLVRGEPVERPPLPMVVDDFLRLFDLAQEDMGGERAVRWVRKHLGWYLRPSGVPGQEVDRLRRVSEADTLRSELRVLASR